MELFLQLAGMVGLIVLGASIITAVPPPPDHDNLIGKMYIAIEFLALNIGHAKEKAGCSTAYYMRRRTILMNALKGKATKLEDSFNGPEL